MPLMHPPLLASHRQFARLLFKGYSRFSSSQLSQKSTDKSKMEYLLSLDFEATCDQGKFSPQEIIEFPVVLVKYGSFEVKDTFHKFVHPFERPELTSFCTSLTGITQEMVDASETFPVVWCKFIEWLKFHQLIDEAMSERQNFSFVTCGNWDLGVMLPDQCSLSNIPLPEFMKRWINLKAVFRSVTGRWPESLSTMLEQLNIPPIGRPHSGLDDAMNVVAVMKELTRMKGQVIE